MCIHDTLSRDYLKSLKKPDPGTELVVIKMVEKLTMSEDKNKLFRDETEKDSILNSLILRNIR